MVITRNLYINSVFKYLKRSKVQITIQQKDLNTDSIIILLLYCVERHKKNKVYHKISEKFTKRL